ncbi:MAG: hypothetical protein JWM04_2143 [Verrucomicrobiales bacterium]|nr:hypothetical protein [Verrucomicrobiales bacterium]
MWNRNYLLVEVTLFVEALTVESGAASLLQPTIIAPNIPTTTNVKIIFMCELCANGKKNQAVV